jgi:hypothetical protein
MNKKFTILLTVSLLCLSLLEAKIEYKLANGKSLYFLEDKDEIEFMNNTFPVNNFFYHSLSQQNLNKFFIQLFKRLIFDSIENQDVFFNLLCNIIIVPGNKEDRAALMKVTDYPYFTCTNDFMNKKNTNIDEIIDTIPGKAIKIFMRTNLAPIFVEYDGKCYLFIEFSNFDEVVTLVNKLLEDNEHIFDYTHPNNM